jgi:hypothetical protein
MRRILLDSCLVRPYLLQLSRKWPSIRKLIYLYKLYVLIFSSNTEHPENFLAQEKFNEILS